jgi:crotonobetainyl-CoA:carnitine CoA-transferase CaiB-like acyl-CoA transferase
MYGFVPSAGAVLGEWGADVVKVEHAVTGDPQRGLRQTGLLRVEGDPNPNIEHANRGKRSIGLDMSVPEGKEVLLELARRSDVFLTSFLPGHRQKFGIDVDDIRAVNPKIIYARGSALGPRGEESVKGGYDMTAFWCRAGTAATITPPGMPGMIGPPGPAYGDTISGTNLAGGIAAALLKRERTGEPSVVDVSLLGSGLWSLGHTVALTKHLGERMEAFPPGVHGSPINPLVGLYPTADDRYISFVMMQPTKFWADVCRHMDLEDLADDPRFATVESIAENTEAAAEILKETMSKRPSSSGASASRHWPARGRRYRTRCRPPRTRRSGPTNTWCRPANSNWSRTLCSSMSVLPKPGPRRALRNKLTTSCWNSVWIGTASSSSRLPARSPRSWRAPDALPRFHRHLFGGPTAVSAVTILEGPGIHGN